MKSDETGWPNTAFEESVLLGKLGVYLTLVIPLAYRVPLKIGQCPMVPAPVLFLSPA